MVKAALSGKAAAKHLELRTSRHRVLTSKYGNSYSWFLLTRPICQIIGCNMSMWYQIHFQQNDMLSKYATLSERFRSKALQSDVRASLAIQPGVQGTGLTTQVQVLSLSDSKRSGMKISALNLSQSSSLHNKTIESLKPSLTKKLRFQ